MTVLPLPPRIVWWRFRRNAARKVIRRGQLPATALLQDERKVFGVIVRLVGPSTS